MIFFFPNLWEKKGGGKRVMFEFRNVEGLFQKLILHKDIITIIGKPGRHEDEDTPSIQMIVCDCDHIHTQSCDHSEPIMIVSDSIGSRSKQNSPIQKQRISALASHLTTIAEP